MLVLKRQAASPTMKHRPASRMRGTTAARSCSTRPTALPLASVL
jgi:hypothetical protein